MPGKQETVAVTTTSLKGNTTQGSVELRSWDARERVRRALRAGGISLGLAVVSVLIPLAHFVLVPAFLIGAPIAALVAYSQETVVLGGKGTCPDCGAVLPIVRARAQWPLSDLCSHCGTSVKIRRA